MTLPRSHYDILGVSQTATIEEIKKRYRELARQLHPDVNRNNPEAAKRFADVTSSYKILSDADFRATYDAEQSLLRRNTGGGNARTSTSNTQNVRGGGTGTAQAKPSADEARLLAEAQNAFARGNFVASRALCEQVLRINRRSAQAYEILGDIFRLQSKNDDAARMYTMSLQINPRNPTLLQRLERLPRTESGGNAASAAPRDAAGASPSAASGGGVGANFQFDNRQARGAPVTANTYNASSARAGTSSPRAIALMASNVFGYGLILVLVMFVAWFGGAPFDQNTAAPLWLRWNGLVITSLGLCGLLLGVTMATTLVVHRIEDELIFNPFRGIGTRRPQMPLGLALATVSLVNFWVGAALFIALGLLRESLSVSMVRVLSATAAITLLLCAVYEPGRGAILLFGGNVVFIVLLIGWWLGDFFRPD